MWSEKKWKKRQKKHEKTQKNTKKWSIFGSVFVYFHFEKKVIHVFFRDFSGFDSRGSGKTSIFSWSKMSQTRGPFLKSLFGKSLFCQPKMIIFGKKVIFLQKMHFFDPPGGSKSGSKTTIMRLKNLPVGALECIFGTFRVLDTIFGVVSFFKPWKIDYDFKGILVILWQKMTFFEILKKPQKSCFSKSEKMSFFDIFCEIFFEKKIAFQKWKKILHCRLA